MNMKKTQAVLNEIGILAIVGIMFGGLYIGTNFGSNVLDVLVCGIVGLVIGVIIYAFLHAAGAVLVLLAEKNELSSEENLLLKEIAASLSNKER